MRQIAVAAMVAGLVIAMGESGSGLAQTGSQAPTSQPQHHQLTAAELHALFAVPHTSYAAGTYGPKTNIGYYTPDGQIKGRSAGQALDTGTFRITDDGLFCSKYARLRGGVENCQTIYQIGPDTYETHLPNGLIIRYTQVPGNPEGL
jgi:hypothetical protein